MPHTKLTKSSVCLSPDCLRTEFGARLSYDYLPAKSHSQHRLHCVAEYVMFFVYSVSAMSESFTFVGYYPLSLLVGHWPLLLF